MTSITLPMPPSVNAMYSSAGKRRVKSKVYTMWTQEAGLKLNTQHPKPIKGEVSIRIGLVAQSNRHQDADNRVKAVLDLLTTHKIIEDDSNKYVRDLNVRWLDQGPACSVTITPMGEQG